jgi:drug/metabolite transporter (DMT)-like permease
MGILIAFLAATFWAISVFPFTAAGRVMTVESLNLVRLWLGTILIFLAAVITDKHFFSMFGFAHTGQWLWMGASGITALGIGDYFGLRMYAILSPRYGSILTTFSPVMALLVGAILLNEQMNATGIVGMLITIIGVMYISLGRKERNSIPDHGHGSVVKGILFGLISAACNGAGLAFSKKAFIVHSDIALHPITGSFMRFLVATLIVTIIMYLSRQLLKHVRNIRTQEPGILRTAISGVFAGPLIAVSLALISIQYINVAVAQTIFALVPVIALAISHFVYKEKITANSLTGVIVAIAGVSVLIWRQSIQSIF